MHSGKIAMNAQSVVDYVHGVKTAIQIIMKVDGKPARNRSKIQGMYRMTLDDLDFDCKKLHCKMTRQACIARQDVAARRPNIGMACLSCTQGMEIRNSVDPVVNPIGPVKLAGTHRPVLQVHPVRKQTPPKRDPVPVWDKPLCQQCNRWAAVAKGMCRMCYQKRYREKSA